MDERKSEEREAERLDAAPRDDASESGEAEIKPEAHGDELEDDVQTTPRRSRRTHLPEESDSDLKDEDEEGGGDEGVTRCVCGSTDENVGLMIQCETCKCWQHCACMGMHTEDDCPDVYYCEQCKPENHIELLRSLGFLPSPKSAKRNRGRGSAKETARELKEAKDAIRALALDNAARLREEAERASPASRRRASPSRRLPSSGDGRTPKRRSTMNSREIGENGWEPIPPELLVDGAESGGGDDSESPEDSVRKRKRSPHEPSVSDEAASESAAELAKRRKTQEPRRDERRKGDTPQPEARKEKKDEKSKHPNQYTYRKEPPPRRDARRGRETGSRAGTPQPDAPPKGGTSALPEHLQHLAYLLPPFIGEEETPPVPDAPRAGLPEPLALTTPIDAATKIRYPQKRMTLGEMRKRVRTISEYVTRVQIEAVERAKRVQLLRAVRSEPPEDDVGATPLSMQLVEQLTNDITAVQRRLSSGPTGEEEDA